MYNRKDKEKELMGHHSGYLDKLNSSYQFTAKTAFYSKGKYGRQIQLFENELNKGSDIYIEVPISFAQAALGSEIKVPTLDGNAELKIPAGTQTNTIFRMRGKGMPHLHDDGYGDEKVKVIVKVPEKLSKKQKELLEEFEKENSKGFFKKVFE